ncbi:MAG: hypothetical protein IPK50_16905 [Fibrobacterota bacterium]|nr:hypothetical protein [Fibrobacterota bacterium]QQS03961.1 MAG: hypothetical protein IPK50_16905 [Fibrobacterota bacterium]
MNALERLGWWKWPLWVMGIGQVVLIWGVYRFMTTVGTMGPAAKQAMYPWLMSGATLYLGGRLLQVAARSRARRLAKEARSREEA